MLAATPDGGVQTPAVPADGRSSVETSESGDPPPNGVGSVDVRRVLVRFVVTVVLLVLAVAVVGFAFKEELIAFADGFVRRFRGWGVLAGFFLADAFPLPIPHDVISTLGVLGGLGFWEVVCYASVGSVAGSALGFAIGRYLSHTRAFAFVMRSKGAAADQLARRYGTQALLIGALTPVTFSVVLWSTGAIGVPWSKFFLVVWLRIPRIILFLWLFKLGLVNVIT